MDSKYNMVVLGTSCFEGMAGSKRIRNLIEPLIMKNLVSVKNLIFKSETKQLTDEEGNIDRIDYKIIGYRIINIFSVFRYYSNGFRFIKRNRLSDKKNIIYNYGGPNIENILFILYGRSLGYRIICDVVEDNRYEPTVNFLNKLKTRSSVFLLKMSRFYAHSMIGISEHLYKRLLEYSKGRIPVYLIPISVNLKYFTFHPKRENNNDFRIFYGGSFNKKDGVDLLINAFDVICENHKNVKLVLTGSGSTDDLERTSNQIDKSKNKEKIIYRGFLSTNDYFEVLNECDIFCMNRVNSDHANTGFPFKLGEFLASGKAVIATQVGDVPKYLTNNVNALLITPSSVEKLIEALLFLIENPEKIEMIGKEGRKTAENYFDSDKLSGDLYSIIQSA